MNKNLKLELRIYGDGILSNVVANYSKADHRLKFFGRVSLHCLRKKFAEADFFIALRDPTGESIPFSFPSKIIEYLATGKPVLSNKLQCLSGNISKHIQFVDSFTTESVSSAVNSILTRHNLVGFPVDCEQIKFVCNECNWDYIAKTILDELAYNA